MATLLGMEEDWSHITERIFNLTLEIMCLLNGENFPPVKSGGHVTITVPPSHPIISKRSAKQKILDVMRKLMELLVVEEEEERHLDGQKDQEENLVMDDQKIPPHPQGVCMTDITITFKEEIKEEEEEVDIENSQDIEGHKNLYKDTMMENQLPLTSSGGSSNRTPPERYTGPLYSRDCPQEDSTFEDQIKDLESEECAETKQEFKEETNVRSDQLSTEEGDMMGTIKVEEENKYSVEINTDAWYFEKTSEGHPMSPPDDTTDDNGDASHQECYGSVTGTAPSSGVESYGKSQALRLNIHAPCHKVDTATDPPNLEESCNASQSSTHGDDQRFSCTECSKYYKTRSALWQHRKSHLPRSFHCSECGKSFIYKAGLVRHQKLHTIERSSSCSQTEERPYSCSECGKCFSLKGSLVCHQKVHTGERPFSCSECGKCFTLKGTLVTHQKIHTGERPFPCSVCGKCFTQKAALIRHQKRHTGDHLFSCSECGECFNHKGALRLHRRVHTVERPFSCSECGKCFTLKAALRKHLKSHTGGYPFSCSECGKHFIDKGHLTVHQKRHSR